MASIKLEHLPSIYAILSCTFAGLVRDASGQKMSKTKGNVIDPLDVVDQFGSDALRYSLVTGSTPGQDVPLSMERIESNR